MKKSKTKTKPELDPRENHIGAFMHCGKCLKELPPGISPRDWAQLSIGWTVPGLQVWCNRHEANVLHVDFEGVKHPACTSASSEKSPAKKAEKPAKGEVH